jgi:hypothetical protein
MSPERPSARISPLAFWMESSAILLFVNKAILRLGDTFVGHDQSWYLIAAERLLSGAKLYGSQLRETNPPLIVWFSTLPVLLVRWFHLNPVVAFYSVILAAIFGCMLWCVRIAHLHAARMSAAFPGLLGCAILYAEFRTDVPDFGQREQLVVVLMLPYILASASGAARNLRLAERCALGVVAALAVCFKPHYALVIVGLELFLALYTRSLRRALSSEFLSLAASCLLYLLLVHLFVPRYGREVVPLLVDTYWTYGTKSTLALAYGQRWVTLFTLAALLACIALRKFLYDPATAMALLVSSLAASLAYDIQHTDWTYHEYPHRTFLLLAVFYVVIDILCHLINKLHANRRLTMRFAAGLVALQACLIAFHLYRLLPVQTDVSNPSLDRFLATQNPHSTVLVLSTSAGTISSVFQRELNWGSGSPCLWLLPAIIQNQRGPTGPHVPFKRLAPDTVTRLAELQRSQATADLNHWQPTTVLIEQCTVQHPCQAIEGKDVDLLAWLLESPHFADAWSRYEKQPGAPPFFDLYVHTQ